MNVALVLPIITPPEGGDGYSLMENSSLGLLLGSFCFSCCSGMCICICIPELKEPSSTVYILYTKGQEAGGGGGGAGRSEMAGNIGPGWGVGGSLPVSPYFSYNLKFKSLYTFGYILDLSAEISLFAIVHSTL